jgi:hypothetical protein
MADKTERRGKQEMNVLRLGIAKLVQQHSPLTIRHLFYLAVAAWLIEKTEPSIAMWLFALRDRCVKRG